MYQIIIFLLALVSFVPHSLAENCNPAVFTAASAPLITKTSESSGISITVTGTLSIIDGCHFQVSGFTYSTALPLTFWFGTTAGGSSIQITKDQVPQITTPATIQYQLLNNTKFDSFDTILLASKQNDAQVVLASAQFPKPANETSNNTTTPSGGSSRSMNEGVNGFVIGAGMLLVATFFAFQ